MSIFNEIETLIDKESFNHNEIKVILEKLNKAAKEGFDEKTKFHQNYLKFDSGIVKFNIGGQIFCTNEQNITKRIKKPNSEEFYEPSLLEGLISGLINVNFDENKAIFIDRNPQYFNYILEYLRSNQDENDEFALPSDKKILQNILKEAKFYHLEGLIQLTQNLLK